MTKEELKKWLLERPSHIRDCNSNKISAATGIKDKFFIQETLRELKREVNASTDSELTEFQQYLNRNGLKLTDVKNVKFWQNFSGEQRFSVNTKTEWYESPEDMIESFREILANYEYPIFTPTNIKKGESAAVINLYDAHIDKLVLIDETNPNGSVDDNCAKFEDAFDKLLTQTLVYGPELIVFPVGNDFFNANDNRNTTVNGTPQDSNPFWKLSFIKGYEVIRKCIDKASQHAKVEVVMVISNHDADKLFYLGQMLKATYESHPHVNIEDTTRSRKYFKYGSNLLGFSHGHKEKNYVSTLPATIMIENKQIMPDIDYIHHFCGDIHHLEKFQLKTSHDLKGCTITFLRALSDTGKWEYEQGYVGGPKTAESFIFKKDKGLAANLQVHI
jgi:hypothetical protein